FKVDGVPVAFEGHRTSCGAVLIATADRFGTA
ncbi:PAAR domain-containing protein, partial [Ralstonia pseudosolanacearum]